MKSVKLALYSLIAVALASCQPNTTVTDTDGHSLWFYSLDTDGMNLSPEKTTNCINVPSVPLPV